MQYLRNQQKLKLLRDRRQHNKSSPILKEQNE